MTNVRAVVNAPPNQLQRINQVRAEFLAKFGQLLLPGAVQAIHRIQTHTQLEKLGRVLEKMIPQQTINQAGALEVKNLKTGLNDRFLRKAVSLAKTLDSIRAVSLDIIIVNGELKLADSTDITCFSSLATEDDGAVTISVRVAKIVEYTIDKTKLGRQGYRMGRHDTPLPLPGLPPPTIAVVDLTKALVSAAEEPTELSEPATATATHWLARVPAKDLPAVYIQNTLSQAKTYHQKDKWLETISASTAAIEILASIFVPYFLTTAVTQEIILHGLGVVILVASLICIPSIIMQCRLNNKYNIEQMTNQQVFKERLYNISAEILAETLQNLGPEEQEMVIQFLAEVDPAKELVVRNLLQQAGNQETV